MQKASPEAGFKSQIDKLKSAFSLGRQNLAALVEAGLQVDVVGAAKFAGLLVLDPGHGLLMVARTAHADAALGHFFAWNSHLKLHREKARGTAHALQLAGLLTQTKA
jgi:hypothetical protein